MAGQLPPTLGSLLPERGSELTAKQEWWSQGVRFQCQGSGQCCVSRGEYGFVFLTLEDRRRMARHLNISTAQFTRKYCQKLGPAFHLKEDPKDPNCLFLEGKRCGIYSARPVQCRTWPWWPEVMNAKTWKKEVASYCPGVGKGPLISAEEIRRNLVDQKKAEMEISGVLGDL